MQTKSHTATAKSRKKESGFSKIKPKASVPLEQTEPLVEDEPKLEEKPERNSSNSAGDSPQLLPAEIKLVCTQDNLANHLELVSKAVPAKPTHPVLGNVLLVACKKTQRVQLSVFDMSLAIQTSFDAKVQSPGDMTIPVGLLSDIVGKFSPGDITLVSREALNREGEDSEDSGNSATLPEAVSNSPVATLIAACGRYQVRGLSSEEFPAIPEVKTAQTICIPAETLKEGLKGSLFATATDEGKHILTGVYFKIGQDSLEFAATDGHRLVVLNTSIQGFSKKKQAEIAQPLELTVPAKSLAELERILSSRTSADPVELSYSTESALIEFRWGAQRLVTRCLEGTYPAYPDLLQQDFQHQVTLEKAPFIKAIERIAVLADKKEKTLSIRINSEAQQVSLSLFREFGNGLEQMAAHVNSDGNLSISFNIKYLLEGAKAIASSQLQMHLTQRDGPAILVPAGNPSKPNILMDAKYLLMPIFKE
ncbi:DNA polymerase III, beta subunit (plasmid) [Oscillatoria nigro-viridis PCC 7112]|uniref:DNA polymerase III, beta subunit n=1 Tax=Phormidium nigroviride PCC 7112 TaxID=179408 RepID=K9VST1_9CYAN|nr:DNA polymerase III subunit beta [Oscillatoria nigro-viridis]AFZ10537.1 DNA polymerase III, beta subunit [Oscillatoria nigro-viridis PCC 7112]